MNDLSAVATCSCCGESTLNYVVCSQCDQPFCSGPFAEEGTPDRCGCRCMVDAVAKELIATAY